MRHLTHFEAKQQLSGAGTLSEFVVCKQVCINSKLSIMSVDQGTNQKRIFIVGHFLVPEGSQTQYVSIIHSFRIRANIDIDCAVKFTSKPVSYTGHCWANSAVHHVHHQTVCNWFFLFITNSHSVTSSGAHVPHFVRTTVMFLLKQ